MLDEQKNIPGQEPVQDKKEETKQDMAKVYGISLTDIEEVILPNGKEYFKFYNPQERTIRMIENRRDTGNLSEQFKAAQLTISASQSENEKQNARAVFDHQLKYQNIELNLIPIRELNGNRLAYKHLFDNLDPAKKASVRVLVENMDYLELEYINIENAFGIDRDNHVISAEYNSLTGKCELRAAEVRNYADKKMGADDESYTFDVSDEEFDAAIADIDVSDDIPTITEGYEVEGEQKASSKDQPTVRGTRINLNFAVQAYQYPEIIERSELSSTDRMIYRGIVAAIHRKRQRTMGMNKNKQYVLTPKKPNQNQQAAFVDSILLALLLGFCSGLLLTLVYLTIKAGI